MKTIRLILYTKKYKKFIQVISNDLDVSQFIALIYRKIEVKYSVKIVRHEMFNEENKVKLYYEAPDSWPQQGHNI